MVDFVTGEYVKLQKSKNSSPKASVKYVTNQLEDEFDSPLISGCDFGKFATSAESSTLTQEELYR